MRLYKKENKDQLEVGQVFYAKRYVLTVDRNLCKGCEICKLVCPREAITIKPMQKDSNGKAMKPVIDIDVNKCDFHGICAVACPFSAIKIEAYEKDMIPVVNKDVFPVLIRDIEVDSSKCEPDCKKCEEECPIGIVKVRFEPSAQEGQDGKNIRKQTFNAAKTVVDVEKELCAACQICRIECPADTIKVNKFFEGSLEIHRELCPDGCQYCMDVCPVNALYLGDDKKIHVNDSYCIYCGACVNVCPKREALELERTSVRHSPIESGAWNRALEKLTSITGLNRELAAKRANKAREAVKNLNSPR